MAAGSLTGEFMPAVFVVEPTSRCNLNCIMCPNSRLSESDLGDATLADMRAAFESIAPYAELTMLYFMGESTLHPAFTDVMRLAREKLSGRIVLSTNASALADPVLSAIVESCDLVIVPIDRWDSAHYARIRRLATFDDVVANAERLLRRRGSSPSPTVVVKALDINPRRSDGPIPESEIASFDSHWLERGAIPLHGWLDTWAGQMPGLIQLSSGPTPYVAERRQPCADLWFKAVINWRGEVVLCCHNWDYSVQLGTVSSGLRETWHSATLQQLRRDHLSGNFGCTSICSTCREWGEPDELEAYLEPSGERLYQVF